MPSGAMAAVWPTVHAERRALLADVEFLTPEEWGRPSLCPGWDLHDVVAHLVSTAKTTRLNFLGQLIAARFDFDRSNTQGITAERGPTPEATLTEFRRVLRSTATPPAAPATRLVEAIVHGEDIRRPLGRARSYPGEAVDAALRYQLRTGVSLGGGKERAAGHCLRASDSALLHGSGPEVRGSSLALLLAVSGRPLEKAELSGEGAEDFIRKVELERR